MTLNQMQYFKAVCQYGSISRAADAIHVSQPSISIAIRDLESEFGVSLFKRENKRLLLTQEGSFFYERVSLLLNEVEALSLQMINMGGSGNQVSLAIPSFISSHLFSRYLRDFTTVHPEFSLNITQCDFKASLKMLESGAGDVAIVADNGKIPSDYKRLTMLSTAFLYCVSSNNPLAGQDKIEFSMLCSEPLILNQDDSFMTTQIKKRFYDLGLVPNVFLYAVQLSLIKELLSTERAGTFLVKEIADTLPDIKAIPLEPPLTLDYVLIWKEERRLGRGARMFIDYVTELFPDSQKDR